MNRFIRYWNQNRRKIIIAILIVAFVILIIRTINYILIQDTEEHITRVNTVVQDSSIPSESVLTGESLSTEVTNINMDLIEQFVNFCNNDEYQKAYDLLSNDCKTELFNTVDEFKTNYFDKIFNTEKAYELELWFSHSGNYTYRIIFYENNILSTGQINASENIEDYITITRENKERKINISGFISKEIINKSETTQPLEITINEKLSYRSYERYSITLKNNTNKTIMISDGNNGNDICLLDNNQIEYDSVIAEVPFEDLQIPPYSSKTINIKFNKMYGEFRKIEQVLFKNIILDMESYQTNNENVTKTNLRVEI